MRKGEAEKRAEPGGLFAGEQRVPLCGVAIDVRARGVASRVTVAQRYRNAEKVPVEAVYSFPLEEGSAVCGFEVDVGGKRIVGKVVEKEEAFEKYDEAMAAGHGAFLLDQDRPNVFTASVGNVLPGQEVTVRIAYVAELQQTGDRIRLLVPTTISPRYIPPEQARTMDPAELDHVAPPTVAGGVPYGLKLTAEIEAASAIRSVECPSHPARVSLDGRTARVELSGEDVQLDQDFVVEVALERPHEASAVVAREADGTRIAMLSLFPDLSKLSRVPCEIVFVLDRSGSMQGESIGQARNALQLCLRSLEEGDRFNIVGFGSTFKSLWRESKPYSQQALDEATAHVESVDADLGGTELAAPLRHVLEDKRAKGGLPKQILLLTDGEVGNEQECIDLAAEHADHARIFAFGIGRGVSEFLVRGLARASRGAAELVHPNERIEPKVLRQFARLTAAGLRDVRVEWGDLEVDRVAPAELPPLFSGDRLTLYARIKRGGPGEAAIRADGPDGPLRFPVTVDPEKALPDETIPVLMARQAIRDIEEGRSGREARKGSAQEARREKKNRAAIVELGCRYGLLSSATSFVAVEERPAGKQSARAELRRIPIALTQGWHGSDRSPAFAGGVVGAIGGFRLRRIAAQAGTSAPALASLFVGAARGGGVIDKVAGWLSRATPSRSLSCARTSAIGTAGETSPPTPAAKADPLLAVTMGQRAAGSWDLSDELCAAAGVDEAVLRRAAAKLARASRPPLPETRALAVVATLVALHLLRTRFASREDEWRMLARKAERWLERTAAVAPTGGTGAKALHDWIAGVLRTG
jgi:Ca-activated chloride channel family protein